LNDAKRGHISGPLDAERTLLSAIAKTEAAENRELEQLTHVHSAPSDEDPRQKRLSEAILRRDLRLARILASQLNEESITVRSLGQDIRLERASTLQVLGWRLDPDLAPAWVRRISPNEPDLEILRCLHTPLLERSVSEDQAEGLVHAAVRFLMGGSDPQLNLSRRDDANDDIVRLTLKGPYVWKLFPHACDTEGAVDLIIPRSDAARLPPAPDAGRRVAWDIFDVWGRAGRSEEIIVSPRMLLDLLQLTSGRAEGFVRLQSRQIAVRPLVRHLLGTDEARCRRIAGVEFEDPSGSSDTILGPLLEALDLYVDEGDILALRDACGDRLNWLLLVLGVVANELDPAPPANRRFDALGVLRRPDVERELESTLRAELATTLKDSDQTALFLDVADDVFDRQEHVSHAVPRAELAAAMVSDGYAENDVHAMSEIAALLLNGLLRPVSGGASGQQAILPSLPLPGRVQRRTLEAGSTSATEDFTPSGEH
jgi:hypothetical protein